MSRSTTLFAGLLGTFAVSTYVMILVPQAQLKTLKPFYTEEEGKIGTDIYPIRNDAAIQGRLIYIREGCVQCHTQQVRDPQNGTDLERGWGERRTVARDYLYEQPAVLGNIRLGPDLANAGAPSWRNEAKDDTQRPVKRDAAWEYLHLYAPRTVVRDSNHPSYTYLFNEIPVSGQPAANALPLSGDDAPKSGNQVVPSNAAKSLVAYLLSLDRSHPLKEATTTPAGSATPPIAPAPAK